MVIVSALKLWRWFRLRAAESEISRLSGDLSSSQVARRKVEAERDDLSEELSALRQGGTVGQEEKKRYSTALVFPVVLLVIVIIFQVRAAHR